MVKFMKIIGDTGCKNGNKLFALVGLEEYVKITRDTF